MLKDLEIPLFCKLPNNAFCIHYIILIQVTGVENEQKKRKKKKMIRNQWKENISRRIDGRERLHR